ncbi:MAG TPA: 2-oxo acid dehydrogenase subunit E2 [Candidatus Wallbacteria bacterium]|nr:MAG: Dihydrolipoyllysine-residue acyltransferase component of branched-chain alpha-ketoacid dehydrogenase complex [bacterium ADurb.Bin243]HPG60110.1 2-oxo acid dehydrogenase subunit E2 [Candidatus Wallbacteria bacterium]
MKSYKMERLSRDRRLVWDLLRDTDSYYLNHQIILIDFSAVEAARRYAEETGISKPSFVAFALYAISRALKDFPVFNSYLRSFPFPSLAIYKDIDICFTVERSKKNGEKYVGLSILKNCENKSFSNINEDFTAIKETPYEKTVHHKNRQIFLMIPDFLRIFLFKLFCKPFPSKMREIGGTCAFTSVGKFGVDFTTPLSPKSITFSLGRVCKRPMVIEGALQARTCAYITLTYDHRIADGAQCASLGARLKDIIENGDWIKIICGK